MLSTSLCPSNLQPASDSAYTATLKLLWLKSLMASFMQLSWPFTPFSTPLPFLDSLIPLNLYFHFPAGLPPESLALLSATCLSRLFPLSALQGLLALHLRSLLFPHHTFSGQPHPNPWHQPPFVHWTPKFPSPAQTSLLNSNLHSQLVLVICLAVSWAPEMQRDQNQTAQFLQTCFSLGIPNPDHYLPSQRQQMKPNGLRRPVGCHCSTDRWALAEQHRKGSSFGARSPCPKPCDLGQLT